MGISKPSMGMKGSLPRTRSSPQSISSTTITHVNGQDYNKSIAPFTQKLTRLQQAGRLLGKRRLGFLSNHASWITKSHGGQMSEAGLRRSRDLVKAFRVRYSSWLKSDAPGSKARACVWLNSAERRVGLAQAFADGLSGQRPRDQTFNSDLCSTVVEMIVIDSALSKNPCDHLACHQHIRKTDQTAGQDQAVTFLALYSKPIF